jgi:hypothetical protein
MKSLFRMFCALNVALGLGGCATPATAPQPHTAVPPLTQPQGARPPITKVPLTYTPEVRKSSDADDRLFNDMLHGIGGVDFYDRVQFPQATVRILVRIDVLVPYNNHQTGIERWTIQHEGDATASYIATFRPDGKGGTYFGVGKDIGKATP